MIGAGDKRELIRFERRAEQRGALGTREDLFWHPLGGDTPDRLASVRFGSSAERREAAVEQAVQAATFRVLADTLAEGVSAADHRIVWDGLAWDITGLARIRRPGKPPEIEFTATASRG